MAGRPFRFGVQASALPGGTGGTTAAGWRALARRVEDLGFSTLTVADHLDDQLAITPAIQAAADATTTLRVGALVWCNDYRHPVVLAKEAATIDLLTDGRLEVGVGAGWMRTDYDAAGLPLDRPGLRIHRLTETLDVLEGLWGEGPFSYDGEHYRITGLDGGPKPVQRPRPPLLLGGGGPRMLALAGRRADIVGLNINLAKGVIDADAGPDGTAARTDEKIGWVREAAGDRFGAIELQVRVHLTLVTDDRAAMAEAFAPGLGLTPAEGLQSPHALCGSTEEIAADLEARRERWGISYIGIGVESLDALAPVVARLAGT
ncbi:MAG: TIGR03621 family F420-dependent LLM class oxidoreductase [Acidimicrobiia bacterium]|nr:TIGR03621 family F420-dependent LLM class oxidoreductase [Acidimicrobiia bacterium]